MKQLDPNLFDPQQVLEYLLNPFDIAMSGGLLIEDKDHSMANYQKGLQYFRKTKNYSEALNHFAASKLRNDIFNSPK